MPSLLSIFSFLLTTSTVAAAAADPPPAGLSLTVVNNCNFTVWPAIQPNGGLPVLERGGFALQTLTLHSFPAPTTRWTGRIWARTGCSFTNATHFSCATGGCGGRFECDGLGGTLPATLAQFSLHDGDGDVFSYGVSLVDGFNVPMTVTPHGGTGVCPVVGCTENLLATCPEALQVRAEVANETAVVGCKSACDAFGTDELCCREHFNSAQTCLASNYSSFFKNKCPLTLTYAHDSTSLVHECASPTELKVIFCHEQVI